MSNLNSKLPDSKIAAILASLRQDGMEEEAIILEKKHGVYLGECERWLSKFITVDPTMLEMKEDVRLLSQVNDCVLIQGETGTGKELIAHALHGARTGRFVAINCAGMPENLIESELFGYAPGSFTGGAKDGNVGLIEYADNGTLFLDEIGDLQYSLQAKLLRCIQERTYRSVGGKADRSLSCRFICATHKDLACENGNTFRQDLYARLSTFIIKLLPISRRACDILLILDSLDIPEKLFPKESRNLNKWVALSLRENVRSIQSIVRNYQVLNRLPKELQ